MNPADQRIERFLAGIKAEGRSSPVGSAWHEFWMMLSARKTAGCNDPPVPLILAASGESNGSKHRRLADQLRWALENECLEQALRYLDNVPVLHWNSGPLDQWEQDDYWAP